MPIDPNIPLALLQNPPQPRLQTPVEVQQGMANVANTQANAEQTQLQNDLLRKNAADEQMVQQALQETGGDIDKVITRMLTINPQLAMKLREQRAQEAEANFRAVSAKLDMNGKRLERGLQLVNSITDELTWNRARAQAMQEDPDVARLLGTAYDPAGLEQLKMQGADRKLVNDMRQQALKDYAEGNYDAVAARLFASARTAEEWAGVPQTLTAFNIPAEIRPVLARKFGEFSPESQKAATLAVQEIDQKRSTAAEPTSQSKPMMLRGKRVPVSFVPERGGPGKYYYTHADGRIEDVSGLVTEVEPAALSDEVANQRRITTFNRIADARERSPLIRAADRTIALKQAIEHVNGDPTNATKQFALAYGYIQALDTYQSAVREGELANLGTLGTRLEQFGVGLNRYLPRDMGGQGAFMPTEVAKQVAQNAKQLVDAIDAGRREKEAEFGRRAEASDVGEMWQRAYPARPPEAGSAGGGATGGATPPAQGGPRGRPGGATSPQPPPAAPRYRGTIAPQSVPPDVATKKPPPDSRKAVQVRKVEPSGSFIWTVYPDGSADKERERGR